MWFKINAVEFMKDNIIILHIDNTSYDVLFNYTHPIGRSKYNGFNFVQRYSRAKCYRKLEFFVKKIITVQMNKYV